MVYRRKGRKGYTFQARTQTGWEQMGTGAANKALAQRIETMWETLASTHRAWDILQPILDGGRSRSKLLGALYDLWLDTKYDVVEVRRRMNDTNIETIVNEYLAIYARSGVAKHTSDYTEKYLRHLLAEGSTKNASTATPDWLTERLYSYKGSAGTLRTIHSAWSGFFDYLVMPKRIMASNPMLHVEKPAVKKKPIEFHEIESVEVIVHSQPTLERRSAFALLYGTGLEVSTLISLKRHDFNESTHEVRAAGTKATTRDRIALVSEWAWPIVQSYIKDHLPSSMLFDRDRSTYSHWHLDSQKSLKLTPLPLHNARHHWAVRQLRAGTPIAVVQRQLGHATAKLTLDTYGAFIPSGADRAKWERAATEYDAQRRRAAK